MRESNIRVQRLLCTDCAMPTFLNSVLHSVTECLLSFRAESFVFQCDIKNVKVKVYRAIILPVVLYMCEAWSLSIQEEHWLRVFDNRVLRRIFGFESEKVIGKWRKLQNKELYDLYSMLIIIQVIT